MRTINLEPNPTGHAAPITHVAFRDDGKRLASSSYDGTVLIWDTTQPRYPRRLAQLRHRRLVNGSAWNPATSTLLATAAADKTVVVWRVPDEGAPSIVNVLARHTDDVNSVAWMPDGHRLVCVSEDGRATMWDARTGTYLAELGSHTAHCMMVSISRDGLVATVGEDGMVTVSQPEAPALRAVRHYPSSIEGCAWSRSGKILAVARDDGAVDLLTPELEHMSTFDLSSCAARTVDWADDDASLVVGAYDGALHFVDVSGARVRQVSDARLWPRSVSVAQGLVAVGSFWSRPHILSFATAREVAGPAAANHGPNAMAAMGDELLVGCDSGRIVAVDLSDHQEPPSVRVLEVTDGPILSLATRADVVYAGTYSGHVVRLDTHQVLRQQLGAPVPSLCFAGDALIAGTYNGDLIRLDPGTLAIADRGRPHGGSVKSLAGIRDGFLSAATDRMVAAGPLHGRVRLWEHGNLVNSVAVLADEVAASASRDHTVKVGRLAPTEDGTWRVTELQTLLGPDESVKCVSLLGEPSAPFVLAGSYDFKLYAWQVDWQDGVGALASGSVLAEFDQGLSCMVQLDPNRVAVAGWDGQILIVGLDGPRSIRELGTLHISDLLNRSLVGGPVS